MRTMTGPVLASLLLGTAAQAIVMRHDARESAYRARETRFPALFALDRTPEGHRDCVATLVHPRWAITAAHCTDTRTIKAAFAAAKPRYRVEVAGREAYIDKLVQHPDSAMTRPANPHWTDVALLRLETPVRGIAPVRLHASGDEVGKVVLIPGWGDRGTGTEGLMGGDGIFRVAQNRVDKAEGRWVEWKFDDPREGKTALPLEGISGPGDSGGPALVRDGRGWATLGVSSHQRTFGGPQGRYGVVERYVRISSILPWIRSEIERDEREVRRTRGR